ncbi:MAG: hypothetical protein IAE83_04325 [Anaerolinea sp.]|nr:hypothetical protein [Anaerolinea sp.]
MVKRLGIALMAIAVLHQIVGIIVYYEPLAAIIGAGVVNTINPPWWDRDAAFWFLMFGALLFVYGAMTHWLLKHEVPLPVFWGGGLAVICVVGVILMPASGFWLALPVAVYMVRSAGRGNPSSPALPRI